MYYVWSCYFGFSVIPKILAVEKKQPPTKLQVKTTDITSARANLPPSPVQELSPGKNATSQFSRENMSPRRRKSERGRPTTLSRVSGGTRKLWAAAEPRGPAAAAPSPPGPRAAEGRPGPEPRTCSTLPAPGQRQLCRGRASPRDGPGREQSSLGPDLPPPQEGAAKGDGERVLRSPPPESGASASPPPRGPTPARPPPPTPQPADRHPPGMHRAARRRARPAARPPARPFPPCRAGAMEAAAVLRVKRKRGGTEPAEALLLACKRLRTECGGAQPVERSLFKLVATVSSKVPRPVEG